MTATLTAPADPTAHLGEPVHVLTYPISVDYVQKWKLENAIAEVVSNAIDAAEADPTQYSVTYDETTETLTVEDAHAQGAGAGAMIFGHSTKTGTSPNGHQNIGQWGEGLKIATLKAVTDPDVRFMLVETVGYSFVPGLTDHTAVPGLAIPSSGTTPKVLTWNLYPSDRDSGTKVMIGVPPAVAYAVMARFRYLNEPGYTPPVSPGVVVADQPGKVYIGGVLVREDSKLLLGYDLALTDAKSAQNRDRTIVENHVLQYAIHGIHHAGLDFDSLRKLVEHALDGKLSDLERGFLRKSPDSADERRMWVRMREELFGDADVFYRTSGNAEDALRLSDDNYQELTPNGLHYHEFTSLMSMLGIPAAKEAVAQEPRRAQETVWAKRLTTDEKDALNAAVTILRNLYGADIVDKIRVFESTDRIDRNCEVQTLGFYQPNNGMIAIKRSLLAVPDVLMETLFHEAAHRAAHRNLAGVQVSQFADRTRGFEDALGTLAVQLVTHLAAGRTLDEVKEKVATRRPASPVNSAVFPDLCAAAEWVFTKPTRPIERAVSAPEASALVHAALMKWAADHDVPERSVVTRFAKAHFVTAARVRSLTRSGGDVGPLTSFQDVKDVCEPLGVEPGLVWWGLVGARAISKNRHSRSRTWRLTGRARTHGSQAVEHLRNHPNPDIAAHADAAEQLLEGKGNPAPSWDSTDWLRPIRAMLDTAVAYHPALEYLPAARAEAAQAPGARNVEDAWDAYLDAREG